MSKTNKIILVISIIICTIFQVLPVIRSGLKYDYGIGFWGPNGHDGIWHLSLINHISNPLSIDMPVFSGEKLVNYHPFFDILISKISYFTHIPTSVILFQVFPIISSVTFLWLSFLIGFKISKNFYAGIFLIFLNTFANSFGWLVSFFRNGSLGGESMFWSMQSASNQINPPYLLSIIFLSFVILYVYKQEKFSTLDSFSLIVLMSLTPITKAYAAIPVFFIFGLFTLEKFFKKNYQPLFILLTSIVLSFIFFVQYNKGSVSLFEFNPYWFVNSMIESPDRLFVPILANMRYALESSNHIGPRLIVIQLITLLIFICGNFGWRIISFIPNFSLKKKVWYLYPTILFLVLIPVLFTQKGTAWNTIQFMYYALFLSNILLAINLKNILSLKFGKIFLSLIVFTSILSNIDLYKNYLGNPSPTSIKSVELDALTYLSKQPKGNVLVYPYDQYIKVGEKTPITIHQYETTSYVSAYSKQLVYVADYMNLQNSSYDLKQRLDSSSKFFNQKNINEDRGFLVNNKIDYIYLVGEQMNKTILNEKDLYISNIFKNDWVKIYKVQR